MLKKDEKVATPVSLDYFHKKTLLNFQLILSKFLFYFLYFVCRYLYLDLFYFRYHPVNSVNSTFLNVAAIFVHPIFKCRYIIFHFSTQFVHCAVCNFCSPYVEVIIEVYGTVFVCL